MYIQIHNMHIPLVPRTSISCTTLPELQDITSRYEEFVHEIYSEPDLNKTKETSN